MKGIVVAATLISGLGLLAACGGQGGTPPPAGLQPTPEEDATGASTSISTENAEIYQTLEEMFRGRASGVDIVQAEPCGFALRIRGYTSLLHDDQGNSLGSACDAQPLLVIDGKPMAPGSTLSDALGGLLPKDVDRIRVLKDVSSTAVYGTRGAHGVVLITLKR